MKTSFHCYVVSFLFYQKQNVRAFGVTEMAWSVRLIAGGCIVDVSDDADLRNDGFGGEGARWWVRYRFPGICGELLGGFSNSLAFFFNFHGDVFLVSLERRGDEFSWGL